ncbi:MAG: CapA family protein [Gammaproteobacteria bacterium]|nr:CapA family protein [Gammaproteobacteria bacterium]MDH5323003.1 CapA family protein [Gammaproteobacteria bacterium]
MISHRLLLPGLLLLCSGCSWQAAMQAADVPAATDVAPPEAATPATDAPAATEDAPPEAATPATALRISIAAVGDMMLGTDYPQNHLPDDDGASFLQGVAATLSATDIAFGNLEGVLADGGEPVKKCSNPNACYLFRSPARYAEHYRAAGFDVLSLANNHARDFGEEGRSATMQALDAVGIRHSGREGEFASFETNGLKIALLAYAVTKDSNMLLDYELAELTVSGYSAAHDIVIVSFHGGAEGAAMMHVPFAEEEYFGEPRGDVALFARRMVDAGADLVLGHGPHVVRGIELYKERLIAYSLGNFATYYGISVDGVKGIAPILLASLDGTGRFIEGEIVSTVQLRPGGPSIDPQDRAFNLIKGLSIEDFGDPGIEFTPDARLLPKN